MGLMDMLGGLLGRKAPKSGDALLDTLLTMVSKGGGLGSLLGKFTGAGLGSKANSWVGTGDNDPLDPEELEQALGRDEIDRIAREAGVPHDEAKERLASIIPSVVDQVSPGGSLPTGNIGKVLGGLDVGSILGR